MESIFFRRAFWGILLVVIGGVWLLDNLFDLDFPLFRVLFSLAIIALGILLIKGVRFSPVQSGSRTLFAEGDYKMKEGEHEHTVLFGEARVDLSDLPLDKDTHVSLKCVFGEMRVLLPAGSNYEIRGEFAFSSAKMPDGSSHSFGQKSYRHDSTQANPGMLRIQAQCTFGSITFLNA